MAEAATDAAAPELKPKIVEKVRPALPLLAPARASHRARRP